MIKYQTYSLNNILLTNQMLESYIINFWNDIFVPIMENKHLLLMCKVEFNESELGYRTLGDLRRVNYLDKELFIEYLTERLGVLTEAYTTHPISKITFSYIIKEGLATDNRRLLQDLSDKGLQSHRFNNMKLPVSMNPADYGDIQLSSHVEVSGVTYHRFLVNNGSRNYMIDRSLDKLVNKVTILGAIDLKWLDTKISEEIIKREIGKSVIFFMGGERVLTKKQLNAKPFRKLSIDSNLTSNFITMDIETIKLNGKLIPYLICGYNGSEFISSYAKESSNIDQKALFSSFILQLLTFFTKNSNTLSVYAHNFSGFDGIFLLKHLLAYGKVEPLIHNGKIISIKITLNIEGFIGKTIVFKDSFLLLPLSLRSLCKAFSVIIPKGHFPFLLNDIFYKGILPKLELWSSVSTTEYESLLKEYTGIVWNFRDEAIKYCKLDCKCLYEILVKFNELIFKEFKVNVNHSFTLPSLAMRIYKSQFLPEDTIYQLLGPVDYAIRESYTGGAVDVYIPHNKKESFFSKFFNLLYYYDVNSLYPFVMAQTLMPVGKPIAFNGDIRKIEPDAYGFFYCKITTPLYLEHPILQRRIKTSEGLRTIAGLGSWTGWIFSGEMDNAVRFGYQFEILKGYQFDKGNIFSEYVNKMYNLRLQYEKGTPMNLIAKLLMNSLYGKFGMRDESTVIEMFDRSSETEFALFEQMLAAYAPTVKDFVEIGDHVLTVRKSILPYIYSEADDMFHGLDINVAIASAITAGARMWMSTLKNNPNFNLYYTDTDSAVVDRPLPSFMVGNALGQFKLEYVIKTAIFLAPKVYALITTDDQEIIKIKGISKELLPGIHIQDLQDLMIQDSSKVFTQDKWFKKVIEGDISVNEIAYTLKVTSNKREAIYIDKAFSSTKPYFYDEVIKK